MPDKHVGPDHLYEAIQIQIFRKPWLAPSSTFVWQGTVGPYYIKSRAEIPKLFKQLAKANVAQGAYDWGFRWQSMGAVMHKAVEDSDWQMKETANGDAA